MSRFTNIINKAGVKDTTLAPAKFLSLSPIKSDLVEIAGTLSSLKIFNGWAIGKFAFQGKQMSVKGEALAELEEGSDYRLLGKNVNHPKYGNSFEVTSFAPYVELNNRAIEKYLVDNFKGVGEKTAKSKVANVASKGPDALEAFRKQILDEPWSVDWSDVGREGTYDGQDVEESSYISRDLFTRIGGVKGLHRGLVKRISAYLYEIRASMDPAKKTTNPVFDAWKLFSEDPFTPILHVDGYGFSTADIVGSMHGIPKQAPCRLRALAMYALQTYCDGNGHAFLYQDQMITAIRDIDPRADVDAAMDLAIRDELVLLDECDHATRYYTPKLHRLEISVAQKLSDLMAPCKPLEKTKTDTVAMQTAFRRGKEDSAKLSLDDSQIKAVASILGNKSRLHILTGGAGCGKTALVETIVKLLPDKQFQFCAPTGKAAKVLSSRIQSTGHGATTIHSLFRSTDAGWLVNEDQPLTGDVLVVDEGSMPSLELWDAVLSGMPEHMHLLVVGDPAQLPSIQAGQVLKDMIDISGINHENLQKTHRNSGGILDVVNEVRRGKIYPLDCDAVHFSHKLENAQDYFPYVVDAYEKSASKYGVENTLLLMSRRQGKEDEPGWNTTYANAVLREICNPGAQRIPGTKLHVNDRIIIRKNMNIAQRPLPNSKHDADAEPKQERVVNGDTGTIRSFSEIKKKTNSAVESLEIKLDDGRIIDFPSLELNSLQHSYALTVHSAQGSEYPSIIGVFTPGRPSFVNRNMLMTGLSRARSELKVFANDADLVKIAATPLPERNSALLERMGQGQDVEEENPRVKQKLAA